MERTHIITTHIYALFSTHIIIIRIIYTDDNILILFHTINLGIIYSNKFGRVYTGYYTHCPLVYPLN